MRILLKPPEIMPSSWAFVRDNLLEFKFFNVVYAFDELPRSVLRFEAICGRRTELELNLEDSRPLP